MMAAGALSIIHPLRFLKIRNRAAGALVALGGLIVVVVALAIPSREKRVVTPVSLLDRSVPVWQFDEHHTDRKSVCKGKRVSVRVDLVGRRITKKKKIKK